MKYSRNVEIKARLHSPAEQAALAEGLSDRPAEVLHQVDTFFNVKSGRLKLREFGDGTGELISYHRPDSRSPTCSNYSIYPAVSPKRLKMALEQTLGIAGVVRKTRRLLMYGQTRIHLDDVAGLGHYIELEVVLLPRQTEEEGAAIARQLMAALAITEEDLVDCAYLDLLRRDGTVSPDRRRGPA